MATDHDDGRVDSPARTDLADTTRAALRAALTGTIFAMSVLAYFGNHDTGLGEVVASVVGTGIVIFLGEAYAGLLSAALASYDRLPRAEVRHELGVCAFAAGPGVLAGLFLLLGRALGLTVPVSVDVALWLGVLTLALCSTVESVGSHRPVPIKIFSVAVSVVLGVAIIAIKAALH
ncbi:hypothetical protein ACR9E3_24560 [Actinomycetospora sp. C-140]